MMRVVTISVGKRETKACVCPGTDARRCGEYLAHAGRCRRCGHVVSEAEFSAALAAAGQPDRWATVEAGEAA